MHVTSLLWKLHGEYFSSFFISLIFNLVDLFSDQISLSYASVTITLLPVLSIADVKIQKTCRTDDSDSCHKPHDNYKRQWDHHKLQIFDCVIPGRFIIWKIIVIVQLSTWWFLFTFTLYLRRRSGLVVSTPASGSSGPWPGTLCCVLGQNTLLWQCLSPPRDINGCRWIWCWG